MAEYLVQDSTLLNTANALRAKLGTTQKYSPTQFGAAIAQTGCSEKDINFIDTLGNLVYSYTFEEIKLLSALPPGPAHDRLKFQEWNWTLAKLKQLQTRVFVGPIYTTNTGATELHMSIPADNDTIEIRYNQLVANSLKIDWGDNSVSQNLGAAGEQIITHTYSKKGQYIISIDTVDKSEYRLGHMTNPAPMLGLPLLESDYFPSVTKASAASQMLIRIYFGDNIKQLSKEICYKCFALREVTMSKSVVKGYGSEFYNDKSISCLIYPRNFVQGDGPSASYGATSGCMLLKTVSFSDTFSAINKSYFDYCYSIEKVAIPPEQTVIYAFTFNRAVGLTKIEIPSKVTSIWGSAFHSSGINSINLPSGLKEIGASAFYSCTALISVDIPDNVTSLGTQAFQDCLSLSNLNFTRNSKLTAIPEAMCKNCRALTSFYVPPSVTTVGNWPFSSCINMRVLDFSNHTSVPSLTSPLLFGDAGNTTCQIKVPNALLSNWKAATNWSSWANQIVGV